MHLSSHHTAVWCGCFLGLGGSQGPFYEHLREGALPLALLLQAAGSREGDCVRLRPHAAITQLPSFVWATPVPNLYPLHLNSGLSPQQKREDPRTA